MRLAWASDIHLDFVSSAEDFGSSIAHEGDALVISGDISNSEQVVDHLRDLAAGFAKPIYFVLGNHDYYGARFADVHRKIGELEQAHGNLVWLRGKIAELSSTTALLGHEGWYDAANGDPSGSRVQMNDWFLIEEFKNVARHRPALIDYCRKLGRKAAQEARTQIEAALARYSKVIFATHFPPFAEACWHEDAISGDSWLPWYSCKAMGDMLLEVAAKHPERMLLVLCGHTHSPGRFEPLPNLTVLTGKSDYYAPQISDVLEIG